MIPVGMWMALDVSLVVMILASVAGFSLPGKSIWTVLMCQVIAAACLMLTLPALSSMLGGC